MKLFYTSQQIEWWRNFCKDPEKTVNDLHTADAKDWFFEFFVEATEPESESRVEGEIQSALAIPMQKERFFPKVYSVYSVIFFMC